MTWELIYTSARQGLRPGAHGFCTVAQTAGLAPGIAQRLESMSGYRFAFQPEDQRNPVNFRYTRFTLNGSEHYVLSRIASAGYDHTRRSNMLAHHVVLEHAERGCAGPAWLAGQAGFLRREWGDAPHELTAPRTVPAGHRPPSSAAAWKAATGDAGWAGVLAEFTAANPEAPVALIFPPGLELLPLLDEALALLPPDRRWDVTFSTYFNELIAGIPCVWRGMLNDSPAAAEARRGRPAFVLELSQLGAARRAWPPPACDLVECARHGTNPVGQASSLSRDPKATALVPGNANLPIGANSAPCACDSLPACSAAPPDVELSPAPPVRPVAPTPVAVAEPRSRRAWWLKRAAAVLVAGAAGYLVYLALDRPPAGQGAQRPGAAVPAASSPEQRAPARPGAPENRTASLREESPRSKGNIIEPRVTKSSDKHAAAPQIAAPEKTPPARAPDLPPKDPFGQLAIKIRDSEPPAAPPEKIAPSPPDEIALPLDAGGFEYDATAFGGIPPKAEIFTGESLRRFKVFKDGDSYVVERTDNVPGLKNHPVAAITFAHNKLVCAADQQAEPQDVEDLISITKGAPFHLRWERYDIHLRFVAFDEKQKLLAVCAKKKSELGVARGELAQCEQVRDDAQGSLAEAQRQLNEVKTLTAGLAEFCAKDAPEQPFPDAWSKLNTLAQAVLVPAPGRDFAAQTEEFKKAVADRALIQDDINNKKFTSRELGRKRNEVRDLEAKGKAALGKVKDGWEGARRKLEERVAAADQALKDAAHQVAEQKVLLAKLTREAGELERLVTPAAAPKVKFSDLPGPGQ